MCKTRPESFFATAPNSPCCVTPSLSGRSSSPMLFTELLGQEVGDVYKESAGPTNRREVVNLVCLEDLLADEDEEEEPEDEALHEMVGDINGAISDARERVEQAFAKLESVAWEVTRKTTTKKCRKRGRRQEKGRELTGLLDGFALMRCPKRRRK